MLDNAMRWLSRQTPTTAFFAVIAGFVVLIVIMVPWVMGAHHAKKMRLEREHEDGLKKKADKKNGKRTPRGPRLGDMSLPLIPHHNELPSEEEMDYEDSLDEKQTEDDADGE